MTLAEADSFLQAAQRVLAPGDLNLLRQLHHFTRARLEAARRELEDISRLLPSDVAPTQISAGLHAFLRESWECLDGLAREINLCMFRRFPEAGLYPPHRMTRQCGFYMVRKILHDAPDASQHPVAKLLWERTRTGTAQPYRRLSFLYNLSIFVPVPLVEGRELPGSSDVPQFLRQLVRDYSLEGCSIPEGVREIHDWVAAFLRESYRLLTQALEAGGHRVERT